MINGRIVVEGGRLTTIETRRVVEHHNALSQALIRREDLPPALS